MLLLLLSASLSFLHTLHLFTLTTFIFCYHKTSWGFRLTKTMSYVPPHLRNVASSTTVSTTTGTLDNHHHHHHHNNNNSLAFSNSHSNTSSLFNASRRTSAAPRTIAAVPDTVFPKWQPSERVSRMNPDQVTLHFEIRVFRVLRFFSWF